MKFYTLCIAALVLFVSEARAQVVTQEYNRKSISVVAFERQYGKEAGKVLSEFYPGSKFDINEIKTKTIAIPRRMGSDPQSDDYYNEYISKYNFADEVLSFMFSRKADGTMDDSLLRQRGAYNATDQDVLNANATHLGLEVIANSGYKLIESAYILFVDCAKVEKKNYEKWYRVNTTTKGLIYKLDISESDINELLQKTWIYPEDSFLVKENKRSAWTEMTSKIPLKFINSYVGNGSARDDTGEIRSSVEEGVNFIIGKIEETSSDWQVATVISATNPLRAKIGVKEGLRNKHLYQTYSYKEDADGNLVSVPHGYIRATSVSDNRQVATGNSATSEFHQISGLQSVQKGWTIKAKKDAGIGIGVDLYRDPDGRIAPKLDIDYLVSLSSSGGALYILGCLDPANILNSEKTGFFKMSLGAGYGLIWRPIQIMPYIMGGTCSFSENDKAFGQGSLFVEPGIRLTENISYPVQVFGGASYFFMLPIRNEKFREDIADYTERTGKTVSNGLVFSFGVKVTL